LNGVIIGKNPFYIVYSLNLRFHSHRTSLPENKPPSFLCFSFKYVFHCRGQAISIRQKDAVGVFFSQIGKLYQVHHVWGEFKFS